ncbi:MAG: PfkB family carbohydrate kinase [Candidatus Altiarchaeota archaeon]
MDVVTVGTMALDSIETPFGRVDNALGGSGVFFSLSASYFTRCGIIGVVGEDFPEEHMRFLSSRGISLDGVEKTSGKTFHWEGAYEYDMNVAKTLKTDLNVLASFKPKIPLEYKKCRILFLANIDPDIQLQVMDKVKPEYCICDTMNYWIKGKNESLTEVFSRVDGIIINEEEARQYSKTPNLIKAGRMLREIGGSKVIIKKGEHGALYFGDDGFFGMPGFPIENVVDPTGAGDSFAGGCIGHLAKHGELTDEYFRKSIVLGSVIASFVVEDFSVNGLRKTTNRSIEERYQAFRKIVSFDH